MLNKMHQAQFRYYCLPGIRPFVTEPEEQRERDAQARVSPDRVRVPEWRPEGGWSFPFPFLADSDQNKAQSAFI